MNVVARGVLAGELRITRTEYSTGITTTIHEAVMEQPPGTYWIIGDEARDAVRELIGATTDEYAAEAAYTIAKTGKPRNDAWDAVVAARRRRRIAIERIGGEA